MTQDFSATGLPPGLSINPSTGVISGTAGSTIASYGVTVSDTDSDGTTATVSFTWIVWNNITVASPSDDLLYWGQPATMQVGASDSGLRNHAHLQRERPPGRNVDQLLNRRRLRYPDRCRKRERFPRR